MSRSLGSLLVVLCALGALGCVIGGCSAIVAPDLGRLGGTDAGPSTVDAPRPDGAIPDVGPRPDTPALECTTDAMCDDGVACTADDCSDVNHCVHTADDGLCSDGERCSVVSGCIAIVCTVDADCSDGDACNGNETCAPGGSGSDPRTGCRGGPPPVCDDGLGCTVDGCDPTSGCMHVSDDAACADGVDCTIDSCSGAGPSGCAHAPNDALCGGDPCTVGATCDATSGCTDGTDRNCDDGMPCTADACDPASAGFCSHTPLDADMDGAPARSSGASLCIGGTDCNDADPAVHPGVPEVCGNAIDDNCSGVVDEGCVTPTGENCATAIPLVLTGDPTGLRTATAMATFSSFVDDYDTTCATMSSSDVVYALTIDRASDVRIETTGTNTIDTVLATSLVTCDGSAFNNTCNDDADPGNGVGSRIWLHRIAPLGAATTLTVYILVDAYNATTTGTFRLDVQVTPVHVDGCGLTEQLDITGGGLVVGYSPAALLGGQRGSCDPDFVDTDTEAGVFRLSGPADGIMTRIAARATSFTPMLYARSSMCGSGTELACSTTANLMNVALASSSRGYVFVDGVPAGSTSGLRYTLTYDP